VTTWNKHSWYLTLQLEQCAEGLDLKSFRKLTENSNTKEKTVTFSSLCN